MAGITRLEGFLADHTGDRPLGREVAELVLELAEASLDLYQLAGDHRAVEHESEGVEVGVNPDGDEQIPLDVIGDRIFMAAARRSPVAVYASEEQEDPCLLDPAAPLALAIDPLDGSKNVALNLSCGVIFSILPATPDVAQDPLAPFLQPGSQQLAAGLMIFGPRLSLVLSVGEGTHVFEYSASAAGFVMARDSIQIPQQASEFAINASNYRHWDEAVRLYFDDCLKGMHGPREQNFNMRWLASVVVEAYRILIKGGVFLYPADRRKGYEAGRLRLIYEANPIAFLMEHAGGAATDGAQPILTITPRRLHQRTPLIFGSRREVLKLTQYRDYPTSIGERSPLFGARGLFRV